MTLSNGREYLAIPGPSVIPDRVLQAMHRPWPNIYTGELAEIIASLRDDLRRVAGTSHRVAMYIANGHGVWEAALANTLQHHDKVLILATGQFAIHWAGVAQSLGIEADIVDFGINSEIDAARVGEILMGDAKHTYRAILAVHVDTATSVRSDISALRAVMDSADHPALLMVDCIASLGCDRFEMDATGIDVAIAGCQKGLMTPAGMGFVFFNGKAAQARERLATVSAYWDWKTRAETDHL